MTNIVAPVGRQSQLPCRPGVPNPPGLSAKAVSLNPDQPSKSQSSRRKRLHRATAAVPFPAGGRLRFDEEDFRLLLPGSRKARRCRITSLTKVAVRQRRAVSLTPVTVRLPSPALCHLYS